MAKKVWISFPLITTSDLKEESVVTFLKGGQKKDLEVEVAAFVTKWLMDKDVPFGIDFDSCGVDRALVIESLPKRLQKILAPIIAEPVVVPVAVAAVLEVVQAAEIPPVADASAVEAVAVLEEAVQVQETGASEEVAEIEEIEAGVPGGDDGTDGPSEVR